MRAINEQLRTVGELRQASGQDSADVLHWQAHIVLRWRDGEPLTRSQHSTVVNFLTGSADTGIASLDLETSSDVPFLYATAEIETSADEAINHHLETDEEDEDEISLESEVRAEERNKEIALEKSLSSFIGSLASAGIEYETMAVEAYYLAEIAELECHRRDLDDPDYPLISKRYDVIEAAEEVFADELEDARQFAAFFQSEPQ